MLRTSWIPLARRAGPPASLLASASRWQLWTKQSSQQHTPTRDHNQCARAVLRATSYASLVRTRGTAACGRLPKAPLFQSPLLGLPLTEPRMCASSSSSSGAAKDSGHSADATPAPESPSPDAAANGSVVAAPNARKDGVVISSDPNDIPMGRVLRKVWTYLWPSGPGSAVVRALVVGSVACVLLSKALKVVVPFWFRSIVDLLTPAAATETALATAVVGPFTVGVFGCIVGYGICRFTTSLTDELKTVLFAPVGGRATTELSMEMFKKLHSLDLSFHLGRETGVLSKDLDRGSRAFWQLAYAILFLVVPTCFELGLVCTALQTQAGPQFIGIAVVAVVAYVAWTYAVTNWRARFRSEYNRLDSRVGGLIVDSLLNYETVKYCRSEAYEYDRVQTETAAMNRQMIRLDQSVAALNFGQQLIFLVAATMSISLATSAVLAGTMTVGDLVLVDALLMQLYMPLSFLGMIYREVQTATQNMQAMIALLDQTNVVVEAPNAADFHFKDGTIELRNVCFEYGAAPLTQKRLDERRAREEERARLSVHNECSAPGSGGGSGGSGASGNEDKHVLRNLSLTIPGGKTVAFVGPSGSGKSTIFRLLYRFYDPTGGAVLVDGQPLTGLKLGSFRAHMGVIPQDTVLFNETVTYNIRYGRKDATEAEVREAARRASVHDTIMAMTDGYDTIVGERGLKLSGGEKQRVAIARALLQDAPILLADEATSALDTATEQNVMDTLRAAVNSSSSSRSNSAAKNGPAPPRTIVLIAHRLSTVKHADIIFVLDGKGGLAEQGGHAELLARNGLYASLYRQQMREKQLLRVEESDLVDRSPEEVLREAQHAVEEGEEGGGKEKEQRQKKEEEHK